MTESCANCGRWVAASEPAYLLIPGSRSGLSEFNRSAGAGEARVMHQACADGSRQLALREEVRACETENARLRVEVEKLRDLLTEAEELTDELPEIIDLCEL